jgi:hypothetical protein
LWIRESARRTGTDYLADGFREAVEALASTFSLPNVPVTFRRFKELLLPTDNRAHLDDDPTERKSYWDTDCYFEDRTKKGVLLDEPSAFDDSRIKNGIVHDH